tara:strand:- start:70 stop:720 length:651 start_codon:yes stop_codon:yes gene_type:complete
MKSYPVTIVDDFFTDPDYVRDLALSSRYIEIDPRWPGRRTDHLKSIDESLFYYIGNKLFKMFSKSPPDYWNFQMYFQKIYPFSEDKWDKRNRGWVHYDSEKLFGGIIYLTKNPDPDTGTSIYKERKGFGNYTAQQNNMKEKLYRGEDLDIDEYTKHYDEYHNQFVETVKVDNVYNRLLLFGGDVLHGVRTFGLQERITISFFCNTVQDYINPLMRY